MKYFKIILYPVLAIVGFYFILMFISAFVNLDSFEDVLKIAFMILFIYLTYLGFRKKES